MANPTETLETTVDGVSHLGGGVGNTEGGLARADESDKTDTNSIDNDSLNTDRGDHGVADAGGDDLSGAEVAAGTDANDDIMLPDDLVCSILKFVGPETYRYVGAINRTFRQCYKEIYGGATTTGYSKVVSSVGWASVFFQERGPLYKWILCTYAAKYGHLEVLQWARENGCGWNVYTCSHAAKNGHLKVIQWARANGCPWHELTCTWAATGGHLEVLQWARANGCPWDRWTCEAAARKGHHEVLQWARANGSDWPLDM